MKDLVTRVWEHAQQNPDGFTLNLETLKPVRLGIAVSYEETQDSFGLNDLPKVVEHSLSHDKVVGGWKNVENGKFYFDSVKIFQNRDKPQAIQFGRENNQIAIFDITNVEEITL